MVQTFSASGKCGGRFRPIRIQPTSAKFGLRVRPKRCRVQPTSTGVDQTEFGRIRAQFWPNPAKFGRCLPVYSGLTFVANTVGLATDSCRISLELLANSFLTYAACACAEVHCPAIQGAQENEQVVKRGSQVLGLDEHRSSRHGEEADLAMPLPASSAPKLCDLQNVDQIRPNVVNIGQSWADTGPISAEFNRHRPKLGRVRPKLDRVRSTSSEVDQVWTDLDQKLANRGQGRPTSARIWQKAAQIWPTAAKSCAEFSLHRQMLDRVPQMLGGIRTSLAAINQVWTDLGATFWPRPNLAEVALLIPPDQCRAAYGRAMAEFAPNLVGICLKLAEFGPTTSAGLGFKLVASGPNKPTLVEVIIWPEVGKIWPVLAKIGQR